MPGKWPACFSIGFGSDVFLAWWASREPFNWLRNRPALTSEPLELCLFVLLTVFWETERPGAGVARLWLGLFPERGVSSLRLRVSAPPAAL